MNILAAALLTLLLQNLSIHGTVVKKGTSDPLSKAVVELRNDQENAAVINSATTEDDGRFSFENIRPGRYRLTATRRGYVRPPLTMTVLAGQPAPDLQLPMTATAAISGRVYDNNGQPMGNIEMQALKATYPEGRRVLTPVQSAITNDLGEYRFFWLTPGRYYVAALHPRAQSMFRRMFSAFGFGMSITSGAENFFIVTGGNSDPALGGFEPGPESESDRYAPVFFGGTFDEQAASAIDLRAAADFGGVNVNVGPVRARHVRGVVIDGVTGKPAQYASISAPKDTETPGANEAEVHPETGSFDLVLLPGLHTLNASSANGSGYAAFKVGDADIETLTIVTTPAFDIPGRIAIEGDPGNLESLAGLHITLRRDPPLQEAPSSSYSSPLADGSFTLAGAAGDFRVNIAPILNLTVPRVSVTVPPILRNAYVKSIRLGNVDVLNGVLHLERAPSTPLEIVIATNPGALDGQVVSDGQGTVADIPVVLVPDVRRRTELYRTITTDSAGRFHLDRIPPGDYKVFAWEEVEDGAWHDPEFLRTYENRGTAVRIVEGRTESARMAVIP